MANTFIKHEEIKDKRKQILLTVLSEDELEDILDLNTGGAELTLQKTQEVKKTKTYIQQQTDTIAKQNEKILEQKNSITTSSGTIDRLLLELKHLRPLREEKELLISENEKLQNQMANLTNEVNKLKQNRTIKIRHDDKYVEWNAKEFVKVFIMWASFNGYKIEDFKKNPDMTYYSEFMNDLSNGKFKINGKIPDFK